MNDSGVSFLRRLSEYTWYVRLIKILIYRRIEISSCTSLLTTRLDCIINRVRVNIQITEIDVKARKHFARKCEYRVGIIVSFEH